MRLAFIACVIAAFIPLGVSLASTSLADTTAPPAVELTDDTDVSAIAGLVLAAVTTSNWAAVAALAVVLLVWAARRFGGNLWPWLLTPRGGASLVLLWSIAGAIATALIAGQPLSLGLVLSALTTGAVATGIRKLVLSFTAADPLPAIEAAGVQAAAAVGARDPLDIANGR